MKKNSPSKSAFFNLRVLLGLILALAALSMALLGIGAFSNASAQPNAASVGSKEQFGETTVIHASRSDLSRPLREQPLIWPPIEADHEANPNPKIPHQHQDEPDLVIQNSFWQRMINTPAIPSPLLSWNGIIYPGVGCNCAPPIPMAKWEKLSTCRWLTKAFRFLTSSVARHSLARLRLAPFGPALAAPARAVATAILS